MNSQRSAARILCGPGQAVVRSAFRICPHKPRARGTPGPRQPRSSVHDVSLVYTDIVTTKVPDPRRSARDVCRFAPQRPRWTSVSGLSPFGREAYPPLRAQTGAVHADHADSRRQWGPATRRLACRDEAAWTAGRAFASNLQRAFQPPLPAQRLMTLIKRPS